MVDVRANFYTTTSEKLSTLPIVDGQIIFCSDIQVLFVDLSGTRVSYSGIVQLEKDVDRDTISIGVPNQLYYIKETDVVWKRKVDGWKQITPGNIQPIFVGTFESFPSVGNSTTLYTTDDAIYKWDETNKLYVLVSNKTQWTNISEG